MRARSSIAVGALVASTFALATPVAAQQPSADDKAVAERLYNDGMALMQKKDFDGACPKFAESQRIESGIGTMLHLADCFEKQGKLASAWAEFREAAETADKEKDSRADVARQRASLLEPRLSTITIVVPAGSAVDGLEIKRDGSVVGRGQWGIPLPLDTGAHAIVAAAPNRKTWSTTATLTGERSSQTVTVPPLEAAPPGAAASTSPSSSSPAAASAVPPGDSPPSDAPVLGGRQIGAIFVASVGVVGIGLGAYFGLHAKSLLDQSNQSGCQPDSQCNAAGGAIRNDARGAATGSDIAFGLGIAALAGGAVLYFTAPKSDAPRVGFGAAPLGKDGALIVGRATW